MLLLTNPEIPGDDLTSMNFNYKTHNTLSKFFQVLLPVFFIKSSQLFEESRVLIHFFIS